jgi:hypothetical protein
MTVIAHYQTPVYPKTGRILSLVADLSQKSLIDQIWDKTWDMIPVNPNLSQIKNRDKNGSLGILNPTHIEARHHQNLPRKRAAARPLARYPK